MSVTVGTSVSVSMTVVTAMVTVAMSVTVGTSVSVSMAVVGISLSLSLSGPLAPGHGSEGASGQTVGIVVAVESRVDVVVQDSNTVAIVGVGISAPFAVVVADNTVADNTVETLGGPGNVGGGNGVGSNAKTAKTESVAVAVISVSASLSVVVSTCSIDGALVAVANSSGPCGGDTAGSNEGISVAVSSGPGGGDAAGANEGVAVAVEGIGIGHGGR